MAKKTKPKVPPKAEAAPAVSAGTGAGAAGTRPAEGDGKLPKPRPKDEPDKVVELRGLIEAKLAELVDQYFVDEHGNYIVGIASARVFIVPTWSRTEPRSSGSLPSRISTCR